VEEWLPAIMQTSSTKSLPLSSISSFVFAAKAFLDEDDREDAVLFQLIIFWAGSAKEKNKTSYSILNIHLSRNKLLHSTQTVTS